MHEFSQFFNGWNFEHMISSSSGVFNIFLATEIAAARIPYSECSGEASVFVYVLCIGVVFTFECGRNLIEQ